MAIIEEHAFASFSSDLAWLQKLPGHYTFEVDPRSEGRLSFLMLPLTSLPKAISAVWALCGQVAGRHLPGTGHIGREPAEA